MIKNFNITETYLMINNAINNKDKRFFINQGGSRSGKTYALCQYLFKYLQENPGKKVSVVRMTWPALRDTVMLDFFEILKSFDLYDVRRHNKTEHNYTFANNSVIEFFATDSDQKVRGRKRDILFCNEANELSNDVFRQLVMRTKGKILLDFNPSDADHWIYNLIEDTKSSLIKTTYKNNGFLPIEQIEYIENLIHTDQNYYRIYALGERPVASIRIYSHFKMYDVLPINIDEISYGLDFGYNHPTALVKVSWSDGVAYVEEVLYKNHLTSTDIVNEFDKLLIDKDKYIYADYSRPEIIEDLKRAGYNIKEANKAVIAGIDSVKTTKIMVNSNSLNVMDEYRKYSWKSRGEQIIDEPIKLFDDCFVGDTLITTNNGLIPIKDINVNDLVLTLNGYKKVLLKHNIGLKPVKKYRIQYETNEGFDNIIISSTPEHKIKTNQGWIPISQLQSEQIIYLNKNLTEQYINVIQEENTSHNINMHYTELYGNFSTEKYQKDITYITKTETVGITIETTLNVSKVESTYPIIIKVKTLRNSKKQALKQQKNGILQKKEENGIVKQVKKLGLIENILIKYVKNVGNNIKQDIPEIQDSVITTARLSLVEEIENYEAMVYDITVEDEHQYFANGILAHNCMDALRYAIHSKGSVTVASDYGFF